VTHSSTAAPPQADEQTTADETQFLSADSTPGRHHPESRAVEVTPAEQTCPECARRQAVPALSAALPAPASMSEVPTTFVYAVGKVEIRYPSLSVEKEFDQVAGLTDAAGLTESQLVASVLGDPQNRYLARMVCWVFTVREIETYILRPRDPHDFVLLTEALRPDPSPSDLDVVIGVRGPIAGPEVCNGLYLPIVGFDQLYSFGRDTLVAALPREKGVNEKTFTASSASVLDTVLRLADNAGSADEHRALNYLAVRYPDIYRSTAERIRDNFALRDVEVKTSPLAGNRNVVDCIFSYIDRATSVVEKLAVAVDVTDEFPFLVTRLSPYFDRTAR
jgi:hypothetical protein